ncbi:MAG: YbgC/FadM family acyl-CoA thioesterase [Alphaproteobacteria bacterium]
MADFSVPAVPPSEPPAMLGDFQGRVHIFPLRVYIEDTDAGGVVYYANYLRYAERARTEMVRRLGHRHSDLVSGGTTGVAMALAVRRCETEYIAPAVLDDVLQVETLLTGVSGATVSCHQAVVRRAVPIVTIRTTLACIRLDNLRPTRLPTGLRDALKEFLNAA